MHDLPSVGSGAAVQRSRPVGSVVVPVAGMPAGCDEFAVAGPSELCEELRVTEGDDHVADMNASLTPGCHACTGGWGEDPGRLLPRRLVAPIG